MASVLSLVCFAVALAVAVALPADGILGAVDVGVAEQAAPRRPGDDGVSLDDDLARKKPKGNATVGEEVITAIVEGLTGESEDSKIGSDLREQFGLLVDVVTNLSVTAINKYTGGNKKKPAVRTADDCGLDAAEGCLDSSSESSSASSSSVGASARTARTARAVDNIGEGRRRQVRRLLVRYLVLLKVFALGIILPGAVLLSLLQSWKAVTLSLMALLLAGVIGIRGLVNTAAKGQTAEVIHTTGPGGHYWRRVSSPEQGQEPDRLAYGAYVPVS